MYETKHMHPSNYRLHVIANSKPALMAAVQIAFEDDAERVRYWRQENGWLVLSSYAQDDSVDKPTISALDASEAVAVICAWLREREPDVDRVDHDGSAEPDAFELCGGQMEEILRVRKVWSEYYK